MLPGNRITGHLTLFFILVTTESSCRWSATVEPPTRIAETPARCEAAATVAASEAVKSSGSIKAAQMLPVFWAFETSKVSILPGCKLYAPARAKSSTNVLYTSISARRVGYLSSRRNPQPVLPQATMKTVSCDVSSSCDVMRTVNIPQRGHANTFGSDLFTIRKAFLLLRPIFPGRTLQAADKTFVVGAQSDLVLPTVSYPLYPLHR